MYGGSKAAAFYSIAFTMSKPNRNSESRAFREVHGSGVRPAMKFCNARGGTSHNSDERRGFVNDFCRSLIKNEENLSIGRTT